MPVEQTRRWATEAEVDELRRLLSRMRGGAGTPGPAGPPGPPGVGTPGPPGADGQSVTVFVQLATPTALAVGDVWIKA